MAAIATLMLAVVPAWSQVATSVEDDTRISVSGMGINGQQGLFLYPSSEIIPKGRFGAHVSMARLSGRDLTPHTIMSLGVGLAPRLEGIAVFGRAMADRPGRNELVGLKVNIARSVLDMPMALAVDAAGTRYQDPSDDSELTSTLVRLHATMNVEDLEAVAHVGVARARSASSSRVSLLWGAGVSLPVTRGVLAGAEVGVDPSVGPATSVVGIVGMKVVLLKHLQVMIAGQGLLSRGRAFGGAVIGVALGSVVFDIDPGRRSGRSRIPALPGYDELLRQIEGTDTKPSS